MELSELDMSTAATPSTLHLLSIDIVIALLQFVLVIIAFAEQASVAPTPPSASATPVIGSVAPLPAAGMGLFRASALLGDAVGHEYEDDGYGEEEDVDEGTVPCFLSLPSCEEKC